MEKRFENLEREPISEIAQAISFAIESKGEVILPEYNINHIPPECTYKDLAEIAKVIREFANEEDGISQVYVSASTSEGIGYFDKALNEWQYRDNLATNLRVLVNTFGTSEFRRFPGGLSKGVGKQLEEGGDPTNSSELGLTIPLSIEGNYFGVIRIINDKYNRLHEEGKQQFGLSFDVITEKEIGDVSYELLKLLKLNNPTETILPY